MQHARVTQHPSMMASARVLRDTDELEGIPCAFRPMEMQNDVDRSDSFHGFHSRLLDEQQQRRQHQQYNSILCQDAVNLPSSHEYAHFVEDSDRRNVVRGQRLGRVAAAMESSAIRQANREVPVLDMHTRNEFRRANELARTQDVLQQYGSTGMREDGATNVHDSHRTANGGGLSETNPKESSNNKTSGYEISEYNVTDYEIGSSYGTSDYQFSEYKSVYD